MNSGAKPNLGAQAMLDGTAGRLELHRLPGAGAVADDQSVIDVVLVHGLTGHAFKTWGLAIDANGVPSGWPADFAASLPSSVQLWTAGYPAPLFSSSSSALSLEEQGMEALRTLVDGGIGRRKTIFVAHSLGGILVKSVLHAAYLSEKSGAPDAQLLQNMHGVIFVGTPHAGSDLTLMRHAMPWLAKFFAGGLGALALAALSGTALAASLAQISIFGFNWSLTGATFITSLLVPLLAFLLGSVMFAPSEHVLVLDPSNVLLHDATRHFRSVVQHRRFPTRAFFERRKVWRLVTVVPRTSADPGVTDCDPRPLDADHIAMCKGSHAAPIAAVLKTLVAEARRGIDGPVFASYVLDSRLDVDSSRKLSALLKRPDGNWIQRFSDMKGDRRESERILREHLRWLFSHSEPPGDVELGLAESSRFDVDLFVWCMWHERQSLQSLASLRRRAERAVECWSEEFQLPRPSLIGFYRPMRTLEHALSADLSSRSGEIEREKLRDLVKHALQELQAQCPIVQGDDATGRHWALDGDGGTRRLLLRVEGLLDAIETSQTYFADRASSIHEVVARHSNDIMNWRGKHLAAVKAFSDVLADKGLPASSITNPSETHL